MIYPDSEASAYWCSQAQHRASENSEATINRNLDGSPAYGCYCLGTRCAHFRWFDDVMIHDETDNWNSELGRHAGDPPSPGPGWSKHGDPEEGNEKGQIKQAWVATNSERRGFCGLAGWPNKD